MYLPQKNRIRWGAILWITSLQYYIAQIVVAAGWPTDSRYSWAHNTISDLGNTKCAPYGAHFVCSPLHLVMNSSFIVLGCTMIAGSLLLQTVLHKQLKARLGYLCMVVAGVGTILVGLFPENSLGTLHVIGAALPFVLGNAAMIIIGRYQSDIPLALRRFGITLGLIGLVALLFFLAKSYLGIGAGGMERIVAYPQSIWMTVFGTYILYTSYEYRLESP